MSYDPFYMPDAFRELREQMERLEKLISPITALNQALKAAEGPMVQQIREMASSSEQLSKLTMTSAKELTMQLSIRHLMEEYDTMKHIRDMLDSQKRPLHPPPLPDEFRDESEADSEDEW